MCMGNLAAWQAKTGAGLERQRVRVSRPRRLKRCPWAPPIRRDGRLGTGASRAGMAGDCPASYTAIPTRRQNCQVQGRTGRERVGM